MTTHEALAFRGCTIKGILYDRIRAKWRICISEGLYQRSRMEDSDITLHISFYGVRKPLIAMDLVKCAYRQACKMTPLPILTDHLLLIYSSFLATLLLRRTLCLSSSLCSSSLCTIILAHWLNHALLLLWLDDRNRVWQ